MLAAWLGAWSSAAAAESDARQRQAAAEAYDQGTAAYLSGDYEKAAEWFETANRMSPAAPALIQAARAHQQAGHAARAATLALRLTQDYAGDASAMQVAQGILDQLAPQLMRVDVSCDGCTLDTDGTLQESHSFFLDPGSHQVTAGFETGERHQEVSGQAGETKSLAFEAPPPPPQPPDVEHPGTGPGHKPLPPLVTLIAGGVTVALAITSTVYTVNMYSGVNAFEKAANDSNNCKSPIPIKTCTAKYDAANSLLKSGQRKQTVTTVLWIATGVTAAATGVFALLLTDWSGKHASSGESEHALSFGAAPTDHGMALAMKGRF